MIFLSLFLGSERNEERIGLTTMSCYFFVCEHFFAVARVISTCRLRSGSKLYLVGTLFDTFFDFSSSFFLFSFSVHQKLTIFQLVPLILDGLV